MEPLHMKHSVLLILLTVLSTNAQAASSSLCSSNQRTEAAQALNDSRQILQMISSSLSYGGDNTSKMLNKWFGNDSTNTINQVQQVIDRSLFWSSTVVFYCLYQNDGSLTEIEDTPKGALVVDFSGELFAYVDPSNIGHVTLGLAFYRAPKKGFNSKMGTIIHELTHFWLTGNTDDIEYGRKDCLALAKKTPAKSLKNADNFQYFIEDWLANP